MPVCRSPPLPTGVNDDGCPDDHHDNDHHHGGTAINLNDHIDHLVDYIYDVDYVYDPAHHFIVRRTDLDHLNARSVYDVAGYVLNLNVDVD